MVNLDTDIWHWYHNVSECHYHIQLTIKYRRSVLDKRIQEAILTSWKEVRERYAIEIDQVGFDQNHLHILAQFLPKYSGGQVIKLLKSISAKQVFRDVPDVKKVLWGGEFWTDGYYIATVSGRGSKQVIINYIKNQGRQQDVHQLKLFDL
jgi:putative transposase